MNEQNLKLEAVKKRCNIAAKITGIIQTLVIIGAVIAFLAGILLFVRGQEWNPLLGQAVEAGKLNGGYTATHGDEEYAFGGRTGARLAVFPFDGLASF